MFEQCRVECRRAFACHVGDGSGYLSLPGMLVEFCYYYPSCCCCLRCCCVWHRPLLLGASALFGREAAIDKYHIDIESDDDDHRYYKIESPTFRMVLRQGRPVFLQIGAEQVIRHGTILIVRVKQVACPAVGCTLSYACCCSPLAFISV